jgi:4-amino-4-deoxy-L-arabinose transferase-like glycosyltransferase
MLGGSCLTRLNAVLVVPGIVALAAAVGPRDPSRRLLLPTIIALLVLAACVGPWLWVQWSQYGTPFPSWAGRPAPQLVATNPFVRFVTVARGPWSYFRLLPQAVSTLVPALLLLGRLRSDRRMRSTGLALTLWIAVILLTHVGLGYLGYSKLLRYVILVTPATILLFTLVVVEELRHRRVGRATGVLLGGILLVLAAFGFLLEISLGLQYILLYPGRDLIVLWPDRALMRAMAAAPP